jgi:mannose-6-phosphate isomerase-like protein (cupin superfamily)
MVATTLSSVEDRPDYQHLNTHNTNNPMNTHSITSQPISPIPSDDSQRSAKLARPNEDRNLPHVGILGDTYTILVRGADTDGRYCLIDIYLPPAGDGPPPHRHDFEESFTILEGEIEVTFRGEKSIVRTGDTLNIPANAPRQFRNASEQPARVLCICSPAGQDEFFMEIGVPVASRTATPPQLNAAEQAAFIEKVQALAPKYRREFLKP